MGSLVEHTLRVNRFPALWIVVTSLPGVCLPYPLPDSHFVSSHHVIARPGQARKVQSYSGQQALKLCKAFAI